MKPIYTKPKLLNLSQGARIAFVRQFRLMSQDEVAGKLGLTEDNKRRTITRYEKGNRHPKLERINDIANILNVDSNAIKEYSGETIDDLFSIFLWLEELLPNYKIDLSNVSEFNNQYIEPVNSFINEWDEIKSKRKNNLISYEEYIEWKINYRRNF